MTRQRRTGSRRTTPTVFKPAAGRACTCGALSDEHARSCPARGRRNAERDRRASGVRQRQAAAEVARVVAPVIAEAGARTWTREDQLVAAELLRGAANRVSWYIIRGKKIPPGAEAALELAHALAARVGLGTADPIADARLSRMAAGRGRVA